MKVGPCNILVVFYIKYPKKGVERRRPLRRSSHLYWYPKKGVESATIPDGGIVAIGCIPRRELKAVYLLYLAMTEFLSIPRRELKDCLVIAVDLNGGLYPKKGVES